jgi:hypothetical protein
MNDTDSDDEDASDEDSIDNYNDLSDDIIEILIVHLIEHEFIKLDYGTSQSRDKDLDFWKTSWYLLVTDPRTRNSGTRESKLFIQLRLFMIILSHYANNINFSGLKDIAK